MKSTSDYDISAAKRDRQIRSMRVELRQLTALHAQLAGETAELGLAIADLKDRLTRLEAQEGPRRPAVRSPSPQPVRAGAR